MLQRTRSLKAVQKHNRPEHRSDQFEIILLYTQGLHCFSFFENVQLSCPGATNVLEYTEVIVAVPKLNGNLSDLPAETQI